MGNSIFSVLFSSGVDTGLSVIQIVILLVSSLIFGVIIAKVYQKVHNTFSYSASFVNTLVILCMVTTVIILSIKNSPARAFALVGALSIIRFRTAVKNTKDTSFVFWTVAEGLALGSNDFRIALLGLVLIGGSILFLSKIDFGVFKTLDYLLKIRVNSKDQDHFNIINKLFDKHLDNVILINIKQGEEDSATELVYNVSLKNIDKVKEFLDEISAVKDVMNVNMVSEKNSARS